VPALYCVGSEFCDRPLLSRSRLFIWRLLPSGFSTCGHAGTAGRQGSIGPRLSWCRHNVRSTGSFARGHYGAGVDFAQHAILDTPSSPTAHHCLVMNLALDGDLKQAQQALQTLKQLTPELSQSWIRQNAAWTSSNAMKRHVEALSRCWSQIAKLPEVNFPTLDHAGDTERKLPQVLCRTEVSVTTSIALSGYWLFSSSLRHLARGPRALRTTGRIGVRFCCG